MNRVFSSKRNWLLAVAVVALGLIGIYYAQPYKFVDFAVYYYAGISLLKGRTDLYAADFAMNNVHDYRYPPFFLIVFSPLSLLPHTVAAYIWYWINIFAFGGIIYFVQKMSRAAEIAGAIIDNKKASRTAWILAFIILVQYFLMAFRYGNVQTLVVFLFFAALYLLMRGRDAWAAFVMALAITVKIFPLVALPYFAVKRRWKFVILTVLLTILLNLLPAFYFGFAQNAEILKDWYRAVIVNQDQHEKDTIINLSLKGELSRYLTEIDYSQKKLGAENFDQDYRQINFTSVSDQTSNRIWIIVSALAFGASLFLIWLNDFRGGKYSGIKKDAGVEKGLEIMPDEWHKNTLVEYSLVVCLILFVGPLTSKIYFIELLLPVVCLAKIVFNRARDADNFNRYVFYLLAAANVVLPLLPGRNLQRLILVLGADFFLLLVLSVVLVNLLLARLRTKKPLSETGGGGC
jgi:hypothetical protein